MKSPIPTTATDPIKFTPSPDHHSSSTSTITKPQPSIEIHDHDHDSPHSNKSTPTSLLKPKLSHLTISTPTSSDGTGTGNSSGGSDGSGKSTTRRSNRHFVSTPKASAAKRIRRDNEQRVNPFDRFMIDRLHNPVWSPSIIGPILAETPPQKCWHIDQISILNPTAIEDSPSTHQNETLFTPGTEAKAQEAIQMFFSAPPNMTSPDISRDETDSGVNTMESTNELMLSKKDNLDQSEKTLSPTSLTKGVNTDLSFPSVLPPEVEAIFQGYSLSSTGPGSSSSDILNASLTRRKLEFSFEMSGTGSDFDTSEILACPINTGAIIHSPGPGSPSHVGFDPASCSSRIGLISPCSTPIRG